MKKKDSAQNRRREQRAKQSSEMQELNSTLGSFGLEPPKRYRNDSRPVEAQSQRTNKKTNQKKKQTRQAPPKTKAQTRQAENAKRKKNKLKRKILFYFAIALSLVGIIVVLSLTVLFKINNITIKGNKIYNQKDISAVLPIEKNQNMFIADTKGAEKKLEENLPYIYDAQIKRKIPSTIEVNIVETPRVYSIKNKDKTYTLLDDNLKVIDNNAAKAPKDGVEIRKAAVKTAVEGQPIEFTDKNLKKNLLRILDSIKRIQLEKVSAIQSDDINNNFIEYDNRITFKLGAIDDLDNKIYSALTATEKLDESNPSVEGVMTVTDGKQVYFTEK
ncbi:MAG: FtsQ-type POTRA domain-containing protein [Eubacterium sp.]|nr:FtsQ-type POTRA domain-containing protein [Eubacterium sp.]